MMKFFIKSEVLRSPTGAFTITFYIFLILLPMGFYILVRSQAKSWSEYLIEPPQTTGMK